MRKINIKDNEKEKNEKVMKNKKKISDILNKYGHYINSKLKLDSQKFNLLELVLLIAIAFVFGIFVSEAFVYKDGSTNNFVVKESSNSIEKAYNSIIEKYYKNIDTEKLSEAAIEGMLNYLGDGYSVYFNEAESNSFNEKTDGVYYGLGMEVVINEDNIVSISQVFEDTPAEEANLKIGDIIIKVEKTDVQGKQLNEIVSLIKGTNNKEVNITILRDKKEIEKKIITKQIEIPSVNGRVYSLNNKKIGYIYISIFALNTDEQFNKELKKLEEQKIDSLIIDVRNNIGGHLSTVSNILNNFFTDKEVIYQINKKDVVKKTYGTCKNEKDYPVLVITNEASASGSEILAAAFKEVKKSDIVGGKTFGKGTVQQVLELENGGMVKITTETWLTSNGNQINGVGVIPTVQVALTEKYALNPVEENDDQLQQALNILKNK